jgi:integrase
VCHRKALFSHIWNYARGEGLTAAANPCTGIKGFREEDRDITPNDDMLKRVMDAADRPLCFAMRLAELTGQRPADVRPMNESQISSGVLHVKQGKTGAKLRIVVKGVLAELLDDIRAFKDEVYAKHPSLVWANTLLITERGEPLTCCATASTAHVNALAWTRRYSSFVTCALRLQPTPIRPVVSGHKRF